MLTTWLDLVVLRHHQCPVLLASILPAVASDWEHHNSFTIIMLSRMGRLDIMALMTLVVCSVICDDSPLHCLMRLLFFLSLPSFEPGSTAVELCPNVPC